MSQHPSHPNRERLQRRLNTASPAPGARPRVWRLAVLFVLCLGLLAGGWQILRLIPIPVQVSKFLSLATTTIPPSSSSVAPAIAGTATAIANTQLKTQMPGSEPTDLSVETTPATQVSFLPSILNLQPERTPTPTVIFVLPPPTPNWPNAIGGLSNSKLSLHALGDGDPYIMEFVRRVHPRVIKAVDNIGWLAEVKAASSATVTIGRFNEQNEDWALALDPNEAADRYIASQLDRYRLYPSVDYWEGWNEYDPNDDAKLAWYGLFEAARACKMRDLGLRAAVGGFAVGVPEYAEMALFMPALEAAHACGAIFTLHEYNSPTMACGTAIGEEYAIPGAPHFSGVLVGYHSLRYRFWYEGYLKPAGLGDLPLVLSEIGIAAGPPGGPCDDPGSNESWKGYQEWWVKQGYGPNGPEAHVNVLAWYDNELRQDTYVLGATIFTASSNEQWRPFEIHDTIIPLAWYAVGVPPLPTPSPSSQGYPAPLGSPGAQTSYP